MEEHLTLHWLEAQVLQFTLVLRRHLKAPLHNQLPLLREMALVKKIKQIKNIQCYCICI